MRLILILLLTSLQLNLWASSSDSTKNLLSKLVPNDIVLQFAGNIGMFSTGVRYQSPKQHWKGTILYGFVPVRYADDPILSVTIKGQYSTLHKDYTPHLQVEWLNVGLWYNYAFGRKYFSKLPHYYDSGYYYFPTAINIGLIIGSEVKYKNWGIYYELGTTDKRVINYAKSAKAISFREIWNIGIGIVYRLKH